TQYERATTCITHDEYRATEPRESQPSNALIKAPSRLDLVLQDVMRICGGIKIQFDDVELTSETKDLKRVFFEEIGSVHTVLCELSETLIQILHTLRKSAPTREDSDALFRSIEDTHKAIDQAQRSLASAGRAIYKV
ncbi:hypothetical protein PIIN_10988, partial [Serendipita indica DSM 11827]